MKRCHAPLSAAIFFILNALAFAQSDSVDVTFYYKPGGNPSVVFLPGEFNNWGPNSNGVIAGNAPSRMTYDGANNQWVKTVRLRVGGQPNGGVAGAYQYKFNENGSSSGWLSDPLNPRRNANDNNNSILYVRNPTIHYLLPNSVSGPVSGTQPRISAYIFPARNSAIDTASLRVFIDNTEYRSLGAQYNATTKFFSFTPPAPLTGGTHKLKLTARSTAGTQNADSATFNILINPPLVIEALPAGVKDGINYINPTTATLVLHAPRKQFVYVIGSFNNWQIDTNYFMKRTPDSSRYWITLTNLAPANQYLFQYLVDGYLRIADPYAEQISDPFNDQFISSATYPGLIPYPSGKTEEMASLLQTAQMPYNWQATAYRRPEQKDLVIYELLLRDFLQAHDYKTLIDTLGYLQRLGVNAIELMPVNEFGGNISWGYNPAFYFAADKYYGPRQDLKRFIDECHKRGLAVILDMVLQHSDGLHPLVRLYNTGGYGPPTADNPWYNASAPHTDFSFGYDFNHESSATKAFVDEVNAYWLREYRVDGFRFDFTRGFTNKPGGSGGRDNSRIAILKRMADQLWAVDSTAYVIIEHLIDDNSEMKELAEYKRGMLLWTGAPSNIAYSQSAMGWLEDSGRSSDLAWFYYKTRGWNKPSLITYMESHDEEWLMYRNLQYGRSSGNYNVKDLTTALNRIKLVAAFFLTIPGPKMLWQFGELGYDQHLPSGNEPGRTDPKPILWNYYQQPERLKLYKVMAALLKLRREHEVFRSTETQVNWRVGQGQYDRRINLSHPSMNVTIAGNFHVTPLNVNHNFQSAGTWYDYFSGDSITVTDTQALRPLQPGEFHIYTTRRLPPPEPGIVVGVAEPAAHAVHQFELRQNYPNPFNPATTINFDLPRASRVTVRIHDVLGREIITLFEGAKTAGAHSLLWDGRDAAGRIVSSGVYLLRLEAGEEVAVRKMMVAQ